MGDIYLGLLILGTLASALFFVGRATGRRVSRGSSNALAALTFLGLVAYTLWLFDQILLARILPFSNLIVLGNWYPMAGGFLGGLAFAQSSKQGFRRWLPAVGLQFAAFLSVTSPLWGSAPRCDNQWDATGICLQTTDKTCSAASAVTLLRLHEIAATEQEMAELCLTRKGTNWMGLYRGLKKKTTGTPWDVEVFSCAANDLRTLHQPAILSVGLTQHTKTDLIYQMEEGWTPGTRHSVVLLGFIADRLVEVAEPSPGVGRERWSLEDLDVLFRGQGLRLVRRKAF